MGYNVAWCGERQIVIVYTGDTVPEVTKLPEAKPSVPVFEGDTVEIADTVSMCFRWQCNSKNE
ncbi:hypothetical protein M1N78_03015 [Peptococcaceae bacterium]|nr:hypothetical protein [Peptococcaceae bacterium]